MTPGQVMAMINTSAGTLGFVATGVGIPVGLAFTQGVLATLARAFGFGEIKATLNVLYLVLLVPLTIVVSTIGSAIPARWAARVSIVQVLRRE
jgi:ABC-type antimicrobial peptide transport system permease subunit